VVDKQALSSYKRREKEIYTLWLIQEKKKRKKGFHTHERERRLLQQRKEGPQLHQKECISLEGGGPQ
jgi:hypothetical protein